MLLSLGRFHFSSLGQGLKWFPREGAGVDAVVSLRGNLCRPSTFISSQHSFVLFCDAGNLPGCTIFPPWSDPPGKYIEI